MALEDLVGTSKFIDDLDIANPVGATDYVSTADDHLRGLKNVLKNCFAAITGAVTATHTELNYMVGVTAAVQTQLDAVPVNTALTGVTTVAELNVVAYAETVLSYTVTVGTKDLDTALATYFYPAAAMTAVALTFTFSNPSSTLVTSFILEMENAGLATLTWPAGVEWHNGLEPAWTSSGTDIVSFVSRDGGTTWRGFHSGQGFA